MSVLFVCHIVVIIAVLATPFLPMRKLRNNIFMIPAAVSVSWVLFGGCVLVPRSTNTQNGEENSDTTKILQFFFPTMSAKTASYIVVAVTVALPTIMFYRLSQKCKKI